MKPETFGLQAAAAGGDLPEEWQVLIVSQASTLAGLLSRMQTAAATMRRRQAPAERIVQMNAAELRELGQRLRERLAAEP